MNWSMHREEHATYRLACEEISIVRPQKSHEEVIVIHASTNREAREIEAGLSYLLNTEDQKSHILILHIDHRDQII